MTTVSITRHSSSFAGPGSTILSCRSSSFSSDQLEEAQIEWFVFKDGSLIDSEFRGGGTPEFGVCTEETGTYTVICRIMADEDSGVYATASEEWTVSAPTFQAECWLDLDAGSDGSGTEGSPFNDPASAASYILSNHVDGATNQSAIHVRKGTTWSGTSTFIPWALETMEGRLIIDTYDTGANPQFTLTADVALIQTPNDMGIWVQDIDMIGSYVYGTGTGNSSAVDNFYRIDGGTYVGLHSYILRCNISNFSGAGVYNHSNGTESDGCVTNGSSDHFMLWDSTITDCGTGSLLGEQARYANISNNTFGRCQSGQNFRVVGGFDTSWIRSNTFDEYGNSQIDNLNIYAQRSTIISNLSLIGNRFAEGNIVIKAQPSTLNAQTRYLTDVWFVANVVDNRGNDGNGVLTIGVPYNLVIRHNQLYGNIQRIWASGSNDVGSADGTATLITDGADLWFDGNTFYADSASNGSPFFVVPTYLTSGLRHRNNFYCNLSSSSGPELLDGVSRAAGTLITTSDYNVRFPGNASSPWGQAFTDASSGAARTLAQWQTDTSLDLNSTDDVAGDPAFIDLVSIPADLSLSGSSDAVDTAGIFAWARIDISGHIRTGTYDAGSFEFGATEEPTPPSLSGEGSTNVTYSGQLLSMEVETFTGEYIGDGLIAANLLDTQLNIFNPTLELNSVVNYETTILDLEIELFSSAIETDALISAIILNKEIELFNPTIVGNSEHTPSLLSSEIEIFAPSIDTESVTNVVINRYSSPFAGYGSVVLDCRDSTFATSRLEEAQIEWFAYKDDILVDSLFKGGGCPEYGLAVEPGNWKVICRILTEDDAGIYATATEEWTVSEPTYQTECWLDLDAVSDGTGTEGSPFNTPTSATTHIINNHVDGATNQSAIHIKKGTSYSGSSFVPLGGQTMQGRLVIDTYDSGANPEITLTAATSAVSVPVNMGIWIQDIDLIGNYVWGSTPAANSAVENQFDVTGSHTTGLNTGVLRCNFSNFDGHGVFNRSIGTDVDQYVTNGCADFFLLHDTTITDTGNGSCFGECSRYATTKDCTFNRNYSENNYRFSRGQPSSIIRDNTWNETVATSHSNFRIHSVGNTIVSKLSIIGNTYLDRDPQVTADFDATPDAGVRHLREVWFIANIVDNRANSSNGAMAWAVAYNSVIRHNQFYSEIPRFFTTRLQNIGSLDNTQTLITDGSDLWFEGNTCYATSSSNSATYFDIPSWFASGFRFRNNLFVFLATGGDPKVLGGGSRAASTLISAADYNVRFCPDASAPWATAFTDSQSGGNSTLAQWQTNVSLDSNSLDNSGGTADLVDVTGSPPNLDIGASSDAIGISGLFTWARVDIHGNLRTDPYDAGADEFGTTSEPAPPSGTNISVSPSILSFEIETIDVATVTDVSYDTILAELNIEIFNYDLSIDSIIEIPVIDLQVTLEDPSITAQLNGTLVNLTRYTSPFDGYGNSLINCRESLFETASLQEATIEWWVYKDGVLQDSMYVGGGAPDFGIYTDPGDWRVVCRILTVDDETYAVAEETWTVSAPTYVAECWLDLDAGSDGTGTEGSPFNSPSSAASYILSNHVNGTTNQSAIHVKRGTTWTGSTAFFNWALETLEGRVVIDTYGTGDRPTFTWTAHVNAITTPPNMGIAVIDIELYGPYIIGDGVTSLGNAITNQYDEDGTHTTGLNTTIHNCVIDGFRNLGIFTNSVVSVPSAGAVNNGCVDFVAVNNTIFQNCGGGAFFVQGFRYGVFSNNILYPSEIENNWRASSGTPNSCIRNNHWTGYLETANSIFRLHANYGTPVGNISIVGNRFGSQDPQITSGWGDNADNTMYLHNVWFVGNKVDNNDNPTESSSEGCISWGVPYTGVIRNNYFRAGLCRFFSTRPVSGGFDPTGVPITGGFDLWIEGNSIFFDETGSTFAEIFTIPSWMNSGVRIRNNAIQTSHSAGGGFINGGGRASSPMIEDSDYNFFYSANGSAIWSESFSDVGSSTLAAWTGATTFDQNSVFTTTLGPQFADATGEPLELNTVSGSALTGIGGEYLWLRTDISGFFREAPYDVGAFQLNATESPTPPTSSATVYTPSIVDLSLSIFDLTISGDSVYTSSIFSNELEVFSPTLSLNSIILLSPTVIDIQLLVETPTIVGESTYENTLLSSTLTIFSPEVTAIQNVEFTASILELNLEIFESTILGNAEVNTSIIELNTELFDVNIIADANYTPSLLTSTLQVSNITISTNGGIVFNTSLISNELQVFSPSIYYGIQTDIGIINTQISVEDAIVVTGEGILIAPLEIIEEGLTLNGPSIDTDAAVSPEPITLDLAIFGVLLDSDNSVTIDTDIIGVTFVISGLANSSTVLSLGSPVEISYTIYTPALRTTNNTASTYRQTITIPKNTSENKAILIGPNFRNEIKYILDRIGFRWAGLRKIDYNRRCSCSQGSDGITSASGCTRCMQTGYMFTDLLVKVYPWERNLGVIYPAEAGEISTMANNLIIQHNRPVNKFDYYLELDMDPNTGELRQPFRIIKYFEIQNSMPILGDCSRVEYWKCAIEERTVDNGRPGENGNYSNPNTNKTIGDFI